MIVYPSKFKKDNAGDVLINVLLIRELSKYNEVLIDGPLPSEIRQSIDTENVSYLDSVISRKLNYPVLHWISLIPYLHRIQYVVGIPGHMKITNSKLSLFRTYKNLLKASTLLLLGKKPIILGVTLEPTTRHALNLTRALTNLHHSVNVRDERNFDDLVNAKVKNVKLIHDLAVLYDKDEFPIAPVSIPIISDTIVISFRWGFFDKDKDFKYFEDVKKYLLTNLNAPEFKNAKFTFCYQVSDDKEATFELYQLFKQDFDCHLIEKMLTLDESIQLYSKQSLILTNRLHVGLLGAANKTKVFIITDIVKHPKAANVFASLGLGDLVFDIYDNPLDQSISFDYETLVKRRVELKSQIGLIFQDDTKKT